ncbi:hypothetical protein [Actinokineospora iranica]|uniref:Uncharacterized protein n=1 Tax=Actinokineospora iranica TaxID=1271860 RepID=A0A1G6WLD4_9PSEU|nr:hypothetical protein [Actinokineospora iranica]SDD66037.1 hypothetical protein SAMN05216174_11542 [Actinokineospora iranica]
MKLYADHPARRTRQAAADLAAVALLIFAGWLATEVREQVLRLRAPGDGLVTAGTRLSGTFDSAADNADDVPGHVLRSGARSRTRSRADRARARDWPTRGASRSTRWRAWRSGSPAR